MGDVNGGVRNTGNGTCSVTGWCSGPGYSGPPLQARVLLDGAVTANGTASVHRTIAGAHGFVLQVDCAAYQAGLHRFQVQCLYPYTRARAPAIAPQPPSLPLQLEQQRWFGLKGSPFCTENGHASACA